MILEHGGVARQRAADLQVLPLDDPLRARHFGDDDRLGDRLVVVGHHHPAGEQRLDAVLDQEVVFEADQEARLAGIALAAGAAAQLQIDAAALVAVRADDIQAAEFTRV